MARGKCTYSLIKGLYGEAEKARREYEADPESEGGIAYGLWLELFEIADWHLEGAPGVEGDTPDLEGCPDAESMGSPDAGDSGQLKLPRLRKLDAPVPHGTPRQQSDSVAVVGAPRLTEQEFNAELARRGMAAPRRLLGGQ